MRFRVIVAAAAFLLAAAPAFADLQKLAKDTAFCPSWAEAHERTLVSLNNGRPPYPVQWKGCMVLKAGTSIDVVDHEDCLTEIVVHGKHWFTD